MFNHEYLLQLASVVNTADPNYDGANPPTTPTTGAVSSAIGAATGTSWPIVFPIGTGTAVGTTVTAGATDGGLNFPAPTQALNGAASTNAALSIADFNIFRLQAIQAFDALDVKLREVLSVAAPTCP